MTKSRSPQKRVSYYYDSDTGAYSYGLGHSMKPARIRITHDLCMSYNLLDKMDVLKPVRASAEKLTAFHTDEYVDFLNRVTPETAEELTFNGTRFLMLADNPAFEGVFEFCSISAGGSIAAANRIASGYADIAINWAGGLHHAKKAEAAGFCYVNDIVLGILELLRSYPRVLYIDIDCHHGDGVEEAFLTTDRVMTLSFHKFGEFFPGTGTQDDKGRGKGKNYALNVPLKDGITDESFMSVFDPIVSKVLDVYRPSVVVLQCGADSLAGDKLGCFNLTLEGHAACVQYIRKHHDGPFMLLGGGGYTVKNVVRTWAYETGCALGLEDSMDSTLPWNDFYEWFGPRYRLEVLANNMDDMNVKDGSLDKVREKAMDQLKDLQHAPSLGMHDVPRESLGHHLGLKSREVAKRDNVDEELAQHARYVYDLQALDQSTDASEESDTESDESDSSIATRQRTTRQTAKAITSSSSASQRRRMSILNNSYYEVPTQDMFYHYNYGTAGRSAKRRFFESSARWDGNLRQLVQEDINERMERLGVQRKLQKGQNGFSKRTQEDGESDALIDLR